MVSETMARPGCWRLLPAVAGPASQQSFAVTAGVIALRNPRPDTEICVDVHGGASVVTRQRDGITDRTVSERGTIWLSPARGSETLIEMSCIRPRRLGSADWDRLSAVPGGRDVTRCIATPCDMRTIMKRS